MKFKTGQRVIEKGTSNIFVVDNYGQLDIYGNPMYGLFPFVEEHLKKFSLMTYLPEDKVELDVQFYREQRLKKLLSDGK